MYKTLIAGRAGLGKDLIAKMLEDKYNWKFVQSYTTRPRRTENEYGHRFITKEDTEQIPKSEIATDAVLNNNYYFSTKQQIYEADGYIVNPKAIPDLLKNCPDVYFQIIYIHPKDNETRMEMAIKRANESDDPDKTIQAYTDRDKDEDQEFSDFEDRIKNNQVHGEMYECVAVVNDYTITQAEQIVDLAESLRRFHKNMKTILKKITEKSDILEYDKTKDFDSTDILFSNKDPIYRLAKLSTSSDDKLTLKFIQNPNGNIGRINIETFIRVLYHTTNLPENPFSLFIKTWLETCDAHGLDIKPNKPQTVTADNITYAVIKTAYRIEDDPTTTDRSFIPSGYHIIQERQETYMCVKTDPYDENDNPPVILLKSDFYPTKELCEQAIQQKIADDI